MYNFYQHHEAAKKKALQEAMPDTSVNKEKRNKLRDKLAERYKVRVFDFVSQVSAIQRFLIYLLILDVCQTVDAKGRIHGKILRGR